MTDIPQDWVKGYIDQLLAVATQLPEESLMRRAALLRAEHAMDLIEAFRESRNMNKRDKK